MIQIVLDILVFIALVLRGLRYFGFRYFGLRMAADPHLQWVDVVVVLLFVAAIASHVRQIILRRRGGKPELGFGDLVRTLWPTAFQRHIARRYLYRRRRSTSVVVAAVLLTLLCAGIEVYYFVLPGNKPALVGVVAVVAPLFCVGSLLINVLSVFSTVAVIGVMLGVAALNVVMAVTSGFQAEIRNRVIGLNAHAMVLKYGTDFQEYEEVMKRLRTHPEVLGASPFVYNEMLIAKEGALSAGVLVKGLDGKRGNEVLDLDKWLAKNPDGEQPRLATLTADRAPNEGGPPLPAIFVGGELARKLKVRVGDRVRLIAPLLGLDAGLSAEVAAEPGAESQPVPPRAQEFRLAGIFHAGFDEYDRRLVLVAMPRAQELLGQGDVVTGIELRLRTVDNAQAIGFELVRMLGGPPYRSLDWEELNHNLFAALALQKWVLSFVLFIIILVAAFNIVASLTMMVVDKVREIAILKAMGMSAASVAAVFRTAGTVIGGVGTALGIGMGMLVCQVIQRMGYLLEAKVYMIDKLPTQVSTREVLLSAAVTLFICLAATLYPSLRAANLRPVDGLRYE